MVHKTESFEHVYHHIFLHVVFLSMDTRFSSDDERNRCLTEGVHIKRRYLMLVMIHSLV